MTDTSPTFNSFVYGKSYSSSTGTFTASANSGNSGYIVDSNDSINVGDPVTFNEGLSQLSATYVGYYLDGSTQHPLVSYGSFYYLLGEATLQSYTIQASPYTQGTVNCYASGTRILTIRGEVPVEELQEGDLVVTLAGKGNALKPIRWLGHRRIDLRRQTDRENTHPIRFRAGAFGPLAGGGWPTNRSAPSAWALPLQPTRRLPDGAAALTRRAPLGCEPALGGSAPAWAETAPFGIGHARRLAGSGVDLTRVARWLQRTRARRGWLDVALDHRGRAPGPRRPDPAWRCGGAGDWLRSGLADVG